MEQPLAVSLVTAAAMTDFSYAYLYEQVKKGHLRAFRVGQKSIRVYVDDLNEWIQAGGLA